MFDRVIFIILALYQNLTKIETSLACLWRSFLFFSVEFGVVMLDFSVGKTTKLQLLNHVIKLKVE